MEPIKSDVDISRPPDVPMNYSTPHYIILQVVYNPLRKTQASPSIELNNPI